MGWGGVGWGGVEPQFMNGREREWTACAGMDVITAGMNGREREWTGMRGDGRDHRGDERA